MSKADIVIKAEDIEYLDDKAKAQLAGICDHINQCREYYGKPHPGQKVKI